MSWLRGGGGEADTLLTVCAMVRKVEGQAEASSGAEKQRARRDLPLAGGTPPPKFDATEASSIFGVARRL